MLVGAVRHPAVHQLLRSDHSQEGWKVAFAKLATQKTPVTATDRLTDRVLPLFAEYDMCGASDSDCQIKCRLVQTFVHGHVDGHTLNAGVST
jgi:hypothetical protein